MPNCRIPPIAYALLLIAGLCIYGIILNPAATFAGMDFQNLNYPRVAQVKNFLGQGRIPLWNWNEWGGSPLLAPAQGAVFYPPNWLAMLLPLPFGLQVFIFAHLVAAGVGAMLLARAVFRVGVGACLITGTLYMGNAFFSGRVEQFQIMAVNCLLPWLLLATVGVARDGKCVVPWVVIWAFHLLAGHPQYAAFNFLAAGALGIYYTAAEKNRVGAMARMGGAAALGTALAAVQLLPTYELAGLSERIWPYPNPTAPELEWKHLPAMIVPGFYNMLTGESGRVFGFTELGLYAGVMALPLAVWGVVATVRGREKRGIVVGVAALWVLAMVFALGKQGVIAELVYNHAPFFRQSRGAARSLNIAAVALALLGGLGAERFATGVGPRLGRRPGQICGAIFCFCLADGAINQFPVLRSVLTPTSAIRPAGLFSKERLKAASPAGRLYRFTGSDSDLYLNNMPQAVTERILRLQPNLVSRPEVFQLDGYEEGLLPTRAHANLSRMLNRNFRDDAPDAALLAMMGANVMFTEYPLPPSAVWKPASEAVKRSTLVPSLTGGAAEYQLFSSDYRVDALVLDASTMVGMETLGGIVEEFGKEISAVTGRKKIAPSQERRALAVDSISAEDFVRAQGPYRNQETGPGMNGFTFMGNRATSETLLLFAPYPGWKPGADSAEGAKLSEVAPVLYKYTEKDARAGEMRTVVFAPFSFRLGAFISLAALGMTLALALRGRGLRRGDGILNTNPAEL